MSWTERHRSVEWIARGLWVAAAAASVGIFPLAARFGYSDLCWYCNLASLGARVLPAVAAVLLGLAVWQPRLRRGMWLGAAATLALELFRQTGFHLGWMPGDLPRFIGVQLLGQFGQGPSLTSDLAGYAYHFWNGACLGAIYAAAPGRSTWWKGALFGLLVGVGFMTSPVVLGLGIGRFGLEFSPMFSVTVTVAHLAFGSVLGAWLEPRGAATATARTVLAGDVAPGG